MCLAVIRAVRAVLSQEPYRSRFTFDVYGWETEEGLRAQKAFCFGPDRHGFVVLGPDGRALKCRPSHFCGEDEIRGDLDAVLGK